MEIPIWWYSNVLEVGMQKMKTWQVTDSWCSNYQGSSKDVSSTTFPELKMKQQIHCQSSDPPEKRYRVSLENIHKPSIKTSPESESIFIPADLQMAELEAQKV